MAIISRKSRKGTKYQVKLRAENGLWVSETFTTLREAKEFEVQQKQNKFKGVPLANKGKHTTLNDFWNTWFITSNKATEGWKKKQTQKYKAYIQPHIGLLPLTNIKTPHISDILNKMERLGRGAQMRKHVYNLLHKVFQDCIDDYQYVSENPVKKKLLPKVVVVESEYLDSPDSRTLLKHVRGKPYGLGIWIQTISARRIGEMKFLRWQHIDFKNGKIHVRGTFRISEKRMVDYPKNGKHMTIKIPKDLLEYLIKEKDKGRSIWVQPSENDPTKPLSEATYGKYLKRYCDESGVNQDITSHCLRHSTHSIVMASGGKEEDMQDLMGHSSPETTRRYIHGGHKIESRLDGIMDCVSIFDESKDN
jgi:integrase